MLFIDLVVGVYLGWVVGYCYMVDCGLRAVVVAFVGL